MTDKKTVSIESRLGMQNLYEILTILPRKILDLRFPKTSLINLKEERKVLFNLSFVKAEFYNAQKKRIGATDERIMGKPVRALITFTDGKGSYISGSSFAPYQWIKFAKGQKCAFFCDIESFNGRLQIGNPEIIPLHYIGGINPIYPAARGRVSAESIFDATRSVLDQIEDAANFLVGSAGMRQEEAESHIGMSLVDMLNGIHKPSSLQEHEICIEAARKFSIQEIIGKAERIKNRAPHKKSMISVDVIDVPGVNLTNDQKNAIQDIQKDLRSGFPMVRLLSGDVGRGKTIPMIAAAASVYRYSQRTGDKKNVAIMLPNDRLVNQVIDNFARFFPDVKCSAVTGRKKTIEEGSVLVGTSALCFLKDYVADFMLIDEQHKFSREQREALCGPHTNRLEATATAIPRSIALITHGGMDVSIIRESPVDKDIRTHLVDSRDRFRIYNKLERDFANNKRILVVYPLVESKESFETVSHGFESWKKMFGDKVGMVHGKMSPEEKDEAIKLMCAGQTQVLVASSIVEVGLDIPDIANMIIVDPQNMGINQIHQLRGRLARNGGRGDLFLYPKEEIGEEALTRLLNLVKTNDGFEIAELDMEARGFGDLSEESEEQNGASEVTFKGLRLMPSDFASVNKQNNKIKMS